jgi:predicted MarR family transcription regulator
MLEDAVGFRNRLLKKLDTHVHRSDKPDVPISTESITELLGLEKNADNLRTVQYSLKRLLGNGYLDARESEAAGGSILVYDLTGAGREVAQHLPDIG